MRSLEAAEPGPDERAAEGEVAFEVLDVLDGFCRLERRSATLDGSVPLRVAQACVPLLEGNAFGFQVVCSRRVSLRRRLGGWALVGIEDGEALARRHRAVVPMLVARGLLPAGGAWEQRLRRGIVDTRGATTLFTGMLVRSRPGVRLRQSSTSNRRPLGFRVREAILDSPDGLCPVVLTIEPEVGVSAMVLHGEIATVAALPAACTIERVAFAEGADVARAHVAFYDGAYFATKRAGEVSRKYRRTVRARARPVEAPSPPQGPSMRLVDAGPTTVELGAPVDVLGPRGPRRPPRGPASSPWAPDRLVFRSPLAFEATFDGAEVSLRFDADRLASLAARVRSTWAPLLRELGPRAHEGALLYLTKFFTPHPRGEPHFFVKPWALVQTQAQCSTLLEGVHGDGYDVMRGVVRTDVFHATPAVLHLRHPGRTVQVREGAPLLELFPLPRSLQDARFEPLDLALGLP